MNWRFQAALAALLAFMTGWVVGVTKLSQILMTTDAGKYPTASEAVAEQFLVTFGLSKAVGNFLAGSGADLVGRKAVMLVGWLLGALFSTAVLCARSWAAVVASDLLLGLNQALCWSAALFLAHDLLGPSRRALASGLVETSGYAAIALASPLVDAAGADAAGTLHAALLLLCAVGAALTLLLVNETRSGSAGVRVRSPAPVVRQATLIWPSGRSQPVDASALAFVHASCLDGGLMACCLVGLALNLATAFAWGLMTRWLKGVVTAAALAGGGEGIVGGGGAGGAVSFSSSGNSSGNSSSGGRGGGSGGGGGGGGGGLSVGSVLLLYSVSKGMGQLPAGALADARTLCGMGPREFVLMGLLLISLALALFSALAATSAAAAPEAAPLVVGLAAPLALALGGGTALAYSPVMACVSARADPEWRASTLGAYRFWRDIGYAVGGLCMGAITDVAAGAPWVAPLVASAAVLATALVFARSLDSSVESTRAAVASERELANLANLAVELEVTDGAPAVACTPAAAPSAASVASVPPPPEGPGPTVALAVRSYGRLDDRGVA